MSSSPKSMVIKFSKTQVKVVGLLGTKSYYHLITRSRGKLKTQKKIQIFILQVSRATKLGR